MTLCIFAHNLALNKNAKLKVMSVQPSMGMKDIIFAETNLTAVPFNAHNVRNFVDSPTIIPRVNTIAATNIYAKQSAMIPSAKRLAH